MTRIGKRNGSRHSSGQILIEALLWTSLITFLVLAMGSAYRAEYARYRRELKENLPHLSG